MKLRTSAAVAAGKLASLATRVSRRGGGTAVPGLVAERFDPSVVANLGRSLGRGRIMITGTNGKTTTSIVAEALEAANVPAIHNREGSNLMRGMASTLVGAARLTGSIPNAANTAGLFETDEATMPAATEALQPRVMAFTNLFRDQLDRYGEVDSVARLWRAALDAAPRDCTLVLKRTTLRWPKLRRDGRDRALVRLDDAAYATTRGAFDALLGAAGAIPI